MATRSKAPPPPPRIDHHGLLVLIDTANDQVSWHEPNLRGSLRGVSLATAAWRAGR